MLTQQRIEVASIGENVTLAIGNWRRVMQYEVALLLAAWVHKHARDARHEARGGFALRLCGSMHDANNPNAGQPDNPMHARPVHADIIKRNHIRVSRERDTVVVAFGADAITLPYKAATTIAQWVRLRAKESKARAGNVEHWSKITLAHEANYGPEVTRG